MHLIAMIFAAANSRAGGSFSRRHLTTKTLLIMKFTAIFLLAICLQVSARSFSQKVTLQEKNASLQQIFQKIERQTGYSFLFTDETLKGTSAVNVDLVNVSVQQALNIIFRDQALSYAMEGGTIIISRKTAAGVVIRLTPDPVENAFYPVHGIVLDNDKKPIEAITVTIKGGSRGVITDKKGEFTINANSGDILIFTGIGVETVEARVLPGVTIMVYMKYRTTSLVEVAIVNTGYQVLSKERATGSFAKPDMKVFANRTGTLDLVGRLEGQIAGLTVASGTNSDMYATNGSGNSSRSALIRGESSIFNTTEPLYVLNGVVVKDFTSINMDDVDDITVLKDAAAAAIWGSRAANGVIVVTTKTGSRDQKVRVSYSGFVNIDGKPDFDYSPVLNSKQYIQVARQIFDSTKNDNPWSSVSTGFVAPHDVILYNRERGLITAVQANASLDSLSNINNLDQIRDIWYRNAITTSHTISVSGGSGLYNFYGSLNYTGRQSNAPGEKNNTYRLDFSQEFSPSRAIKISLNTSLQNRISSSKNPISITNSFLPYQLFKDANGNSISMPGIKGLTDSLRQDYEARSRVSLDYNPVEEMNYSHSSSNNLSINITANASVKLWKGLSFLGTYGYLTSPGTTNSYEDHKKYDLRQQLVSLTIAPDVNSEPVYLLPATGGTYRTYTNNQRNWTVRNQLAYNFTSGNGNNVVNLQFGQDASEGVSSRTSNVLRGYDENLQTYTVIDISKFGSGFVSGTVPGYGYFSENPYSTEEDRSRYTSWFGLASYTLNRKYSIDGSWRVDHASLFGNDVSAQNKPVYSFGAKWNIAREDFMNTVTWLNELQLRATYGITGNSPSGSTTTKTVVRPEFTYSTPLVGGQAYVLSSAANTKLTWESTHTKNIGIDFSLFDRRLNGSMEYYHKDTKGLLGNAAFDPFTGVSSGVANIGNCTNTGFEMSLRTINIKTEKFSWSSGLVISHNRSKLVTYSKPSSYSMTASARIYSPYVAGYSMNSLWAYRYAGLDKVGDPQIYLNDKTITKAPQSGGVDDVAHMGTTIPVINGGFSNNFSYKGFDLAVNMIYNFGAVMRRDVNRFFYSGRLASNTGFGGNDVNVDFLNAWKKPGDEAITNTPAYRADGYYNYSQRDVGYYGNGDINVVSASYIKIRDITLSYNIARSVVRLLGVEGASLRFQVNNFMVWKNNKYNIDPEYQDFMNGYRSIRVNQHAISVGANVNF